MNQYETYTRIQLKGQIQNITDVIARSFIIMSLYGTYGGSWEQVLVNRFSMNPIDEKRGAPVYMKKNGRLKSYYDLDMSFCYSIFRDPYYQNVFANKPIRHELNDLRVSRNELAHNNRSESELRVEELQQAIQAQKTFLDRWKRVDPTGCNDDLYRKLNQAITAEQQTAQFLLTGNENLRRTIPSPTQDLLPKDRPIFRGDTPLPAPNQMGTPQAAAQPSYQQKSRFASRSGSGYNRSNSYSRPPKKSSSSGKGLAVAVVALYVVLALVIVSFIGFIGFKVVNGISSAKQHVSSIVAVVPEEQEEQKPVQEEEVIVPSSPANDETKSEVESSQLKEQLESGEYSEKPHSDQEKTAPGAQIENESQYYSVSEKFKVRINSISFNEKCWNDIRGVKVTFDYENDYGGEVAVEETHFYLGDNQDQSNNWTERSDFGGSDILSPTPKGPKQFELYFPGVTEENGNGLITIKFGHWSREAGEISFKR